MRVDANAFTRGLLAGSALLLLGGGPAWAVDAEAFGNRLQSALKQTGVSLSFASVEEEGSDVVVRKATLGAGDEEVAVGDLRFENVSGSVEEGFKAARLPIESIGEQDLGTSWGADNIVLEDIQLAGTSAGAVTPLPTPFYFERLAVEEFTTSREGEDEVTIREVEIANEVADGGVVTSTADVGSFDIDLSAHEPTDFLRALDTMGYQGLSGSASSEATWDPRTGELVIKPVQLEIEDVGAVRSAITISGVTRAFGSSLAEFLEEDDPSEIEVLGPVSHVALKELDISLENESLLERLVGFYADKESLPRDQVKQNAGTILPPILHGLQNEGFQKAIGAAVADLLTKPQSESINVSVRPEMPIAGPVILGAAVGSPETLPDVLGVKIQANESSMDSAAASGTSGPDAAKDEESGKRR